MDLTIPMRQDSPSISATEVHIAAEVGSCHPARHHHSSAAQGVTATAG